jgi:ABC-type transport system substrate-binding protein
MTDEARQQAAIGKLLQRREALKLMGASAVAVSLGGTASADTPKRGGILKVAAPNNPTSLDPYTGGGGLDHTHLYNIFDNLIEFDYETLKPIPGLAESWQFADPKTLVLNLRPGVLFHDGTPCNAEAVKWNIDNGRSDPRSNVKADFVTVDSVDVTGANQVTLRLKQPDTALPLILADRAGMMSSPKAVQELGKEHNRKPVGTGPYTLVSWVDGDKIILKRNEKYWRPGRPYLDGIEISVITEIGTAVRSVLAGDNNYVYFMSPQQKPLVDRARNLSVVSAPTVYCLLVYFNYSRPPFNDVRIRKAINYAVNRDDFVKLTLGGVAETATMLLPKSHWAYDKTTAGMYPHDLDKAKKLLAEAGHKDGLDLTLVSYTDQTYLRRQEVLIEQLSKAGIRLRFINGTITTGMFFSEQKGDGLLAAWTGRPDPSLSYSLMFLKDAYYNPGRVEVSSELTDAINASRVSENIEERAKVFAKVQQLTMEHALCVPLAFQPELDAFHTKVKGYRPNLLGKPKFEHIYLDG